MQAQPAPTWLASLKLLQLHPLTPVLGLPGVLEPPSISKYTLSNYSYQMIELQVVAPCSHLKAQAIMAILLLILYTIVSAPYKILGNLCWVYNIATLCKSALMIA